MCRFILTKIYWLFDWNWNCHLCLRFVVSNAHLGCTWVENMQQRANANPHIECKCPLTINNAHLRSEVLEEQTSRRSCTCQPSGHQSVSAVQCAVCSVHCAVCIVHLFTAPDKMLNTWVTPLLHHHLVGRHPTVVATSIIIKAEARSVPSQLWPCWQKILPKKNKPLNSSIWQIWKKQQGNVLRQRPPLHWFFYTGTSAWSHILFDATTTRPV